MQYTKFLKENSYDIYSIENKISINNIYILYHDQSSFNKLGNDWSKPRTRFLIRFPQKRHTHSPD